MSIDVFGRHLGSNKIVKGPPGIGFNLTKQGDFDLENKKLCNIANPVDDKDAVNFKTLQDKLTDESNILWEAFEKIEKRLEALEKEENVYNFTKPVKKNPIIIVKGK